ncbi:titin-like [Anopheles moucheti]|uniref:titin-like n=1 Tax=Anopheles moucheti TaxID=186751 RepID=UPI0022F0ECE2|nr:titin-like [Anopheles moucheti]
MKLLFALCALAALLQVSIATHDLNVPVLVPVPHIKKVPIGIPKIERTKGEIIKHVPEAVIKRVPVEKHVEVEKEVEIVKHVPVTKEIVVERPVEVIREVPIEKVVIEKVEVPYEVIKHVEKIKHIPVEKHIEVIKEVEEIREVPYKRYVFNKKPFPVPYNEPEEVQVPYTVPAPVAPVVAVVEAEEPSLKDKFHNLAGNYLPDPVGFFKKIVKH